MQIQPEARAAIPDIVVITDDAGKVLARNADRNRMYGIRLDTALPAVRAAVKDGGAHHDVWKKDDEGKLLELAVSAIRGDGGNIVGTLVVGYDLSNGLARSEGQRLGGRDVAFLVDDKVYSSSLQRDRGQAASRLPLRSPARLPPRAP